MPTLLDRAAAALAVLLTLLASGCFGGAGGPGEEQAGDPALGQAEAPHVSVGDQWRLASDPDASQVTWFIEKAVEEEVELAYGGGTVPSYRIVSRMEVEEGATRILTDLTEWRRTTDFALLKDESVTHITFPGQPEATVQTWRTMDEPCLEMRWPISPGARWEVSCAFSMQKHSQGAAVPGQGETQSRPVESRGTLEATYEVGDLETVEVPAGTFEAFRIERTDSEDRTQMEWFAPDACSVVKATGGNGDEARLETYVCMAAA